MATASAKVSHVLYLFSVCAYVFVGLNGSECLWMFSSDCLYFFLLKSEAGSSGESENMGEKTET